MHLHRPPSQQLTPFKKITHLPLLRPEVVRFHAPSIVLFCTPLNKDRPTTYIINNQDGYQFTFEIYKSSQIEYQFTDCSFGDTGYYFSNRYEILSVMIQI